MKKVIVLIICLLLASSAFAFEKGTKRIGGTIGFDSYKLNSDTDATTTFEIDPHLGYFITDNISANLLIDFNSKKGPYSYYPKGSGTSTITTLLLGIGGAYFYQNFYGGLGFLYKSYSSKTTTKSDDKWTSGSMYLKVEAGYLYNIANNVYLDIGADYKKGFGEYSGDAEGDNETSQFLIGVGIAVMIP